MKHHLHRFDDSLVRLIRRAPAWLAPILRYATLLGEPLLTLGIVSGVMGYGFVLANWPVVAASSIAVGIIVINSLLKLVLKRKRPVTYIVNNILLKTYSFPSGHTAGAMASFGLLGYVATLYAGSSVGVYAAIAMICFLVGISRVYVGAHYPTDVIGGWIVGSLGIALMATIGSL